MLSSLETFSGEAQLKKHPVTMNVGASKKWKAEWNKSQMWDSLCFGQVNTLSKTQRAKSSFDTHKGCKNYICRLG